MFVYSRHTYSISIQRLCFRIPLFRKSVRLCCAVPFAPDYRIFVMYNIDIYRGIPYTTARQGVSIYKAYTRHFVVYIHLSLNYLLMFSNYISDVDTYYTYERKRKYLRTYK